MDDSFHYHQRQFIGRKFVGTSIPIFSWLWGPKHAWLPAAPIIKKRVWKSRKNTRNSGRNAKEIVSVKQSHFIIRVRTNKCCKYETASRWNCLNEPSRVSGSDLTEGALHWGFLKSRRKTSSARFVPMLYPTKYLKLTTDVCERKKL